jgi:hypothetical protein
MPSYVQVLPLLTAIAAFAGFLFGLALLAKEHHASPCLQKIFTGLVLVALMFAADEGWRCALQHQAIDWRLTLFAIGVAGAWACRLAGLTGTAPAKPAARSPRPRTPFAH